MPFLAALSAGAEWFLPQEEACRGERRRDRITGYSGGGENRGPEEGDDRAEAAAGEGAFIQDDAGRSGNQKRPQQGVRFQQSKMCGRRLTFASCSACQMRSLDAQLYPEKLKAIAQQFQEQQAQTQTQGLVRLQQQKQLDRDLTPANSPQVGSTYIYPLLTYTAVQLRELYSCVDKGCSFLGLSTPTFALYSVVCCQISIYRLCCPSLD